MRWIPVFHVVPALLLAYWASNNLHNAKWTTVAAWSVVAAAYATSVLLSLCGHIPSTRLLLAPTMLIFGSSILFVGYNFWEFFRGNSIYLDSPGTVLVVGVFAFFTLLPATLVLVLFWLYRKQIFRESRVK